MFDRCPGMLAKSFEKASFATFYGTETVYGFMQRAAALGATVFVARALDPSWATLTY
jgi:hypothetical protein